MLLSLRGGEMGPQRPGHPSSDTQCPHLAATIYFSPICPCGQRNGLKARSAVALIHLWTQMASCVSGRERHSPKCDSMCTQSKANPPLGLKARILVSQLFGRFIQIHPEHKNALGNREPLSEGRRLCKRAKVSAGLMHTSEAASSVPHCHQTGQPPHTTTALESPVYIRVQGLLGWTMCVEDGGGQCERAAGL